MTPTWAEWNARNSATPQFGTPGSNYAQFGSDGTFRLYGTATGYEDLRQDVTGTRTGVVAPTTGVGFRGDNAYYHTTFVHTQADEVQFEVQLPHGGRLGSVIYPHVHFAPTAAGGATNAAKFILGYRWANPDAQFASGEATYPMVKTWTGDKQYYHLIADGAGLTLANWSLSAILKCRLYRDNTVADNIAAAITFLYFDIHLEIDSFGSAEEYIK